MIRTVSITILNLILCHFSAVGHTLDSSIYGKPQTQTQTVSSGFDLTSNDSVKVEKINLLPGQSGLLLKEILTSIPKSNDPKKMDSLTIQLDRGGDMSGGGSTLSQSNQRFFLDLYKENVSVNFSLCNLNSSSKQIQTLSKFNFKTTCLNDAIVQVLNRTQTIAPRLHRALLAVYKNIPFYFSPGKFRILDENFYLNPLKTFDSDMTISTTALYIKNIGIIISFPQFVELNEVHQAGLIIHEILRSLQIQFSLGMANAEIQEIVAALFSGDESHLLTILKNSRLKDFLESPKEQDSLLNEIFSYYSELINLNQRLGTIEVQRLEGLMKSETTTWSFDLSDILAQTSHEILSYRIRSKQKISDEELIQLEDLEEKFDRMVSKVRARGIGGIYTEKLDRVAELTGFVLNSSGFSSAYCADFTEDNQMCSILWKKLKNLID